MLSLPLTEMSNDDLQTELNTIGSDILIRYPERNPLKLKLGNIIKGLGNYCQMIDIFS